MIKMVGVILLQKFMEGTGYESHNKKKTVNYFKNASLVYICVHETRPQKK